MTDGYKTQQKTELISYLKSMRGSHVTVNQIVDHFEKIKVKIGLTTIYRQLNKMVEDGYVKKYFIDERAGSCFEFIDKNCDHSNHSHFHLKCETCDRLIHFDCQEVTDLQTHILEEHDFEINPVRTVFYGLCGECSKLRRKEAKYSI